MRASGRREVSRPPAPAAQPWRCVFAAECGTARARACGLFCTLNEFDQTETAARIETHVSDPKQHFPGPTALHFVLLLYFGCAFACFASRLDDRNPSGYAQVLEELIPDGVNPLKVTRVYSYGHDLISQQPVAGAESYYGYDGHGNVRFLISAAGDITDTYTYDAFGVLLATTGSTANNYLSCGEQYDFDLGTYYLRARYVNPNTGRFWTMDTYEGSPSDPLSLHKYLYCHSDPVNFTDPSGNVEFSILGINVSIDNRLIIGTLVLTGAAIAYHRYVWDPTEHDMRAIPITELEAELGREPERETRLDQVIDSSGQKKFRDVGLVSGGRMSVVMNTENGRPVQRIRYIW